MSFKTALRLCGLTQPGAAKIFGIAKITVESYCQSRRNVPKHISQHLAAIYADIQSEAKGKSVRLSDNHSEWWGENDNAESTVAVLEAINRKGG